MKVMPEATSELKNQNKIVFVLQVEQACYEAVHQI